MREFHPKRILGALVQYNVDFVLIGGMAGMARGSNYPSYDIDIAYARDRDNLERLASALRELGATLRGAPRGLPFLLDAETLEGRSHFTFDTPYGALDIPSDPDGAPPTFSFGPPRESRLMSRASGSASPRSTI